MAEKWQVLNLPEDMSGLSFLDIGCWEGAACVEAVKRGASKVVGLDLCTSDALHDNLAAHDFSFIQMDVFSEKFWELPNFDIVLCAGVLYHVENVLSLLFRMRKTVTKLLILETVINTESPDKPVMLFYPGRELGNNPSNWWSPNERCLLDMLGVVGFGEISTVYDAPASEGTRRYGVHAIPTGYVDSDKVLPRLPSRMSVHGGQRLGF